MEQPLSPEDQESILESYIEKLGGNLEDLERHGQPERFLNLQERIAVLIGTSTNTELLTEIGDDGRLYVADVAKARLLNM